MEQSRIWDYFQNAGADSFRGARPRLAFLAGRIAKGADVLDIGIGDGTFERIASARGLRVHVIDPDAKAIERARTELGLGDRAKIGVGTALPWPDGSFDAVVASEVLEHLDDATLRGTLVEANRVLRPHGRLIGTVPAEERLDEQRVVCPDCGRRFHRWGHEQTFSPQRLQSVLNEALFGAEVRRRWFVAWSLLNWKGRLQAATRKSLAVAGIWGSGHNLVFSARKRTQSS
jgi:SAM-dependent methyltransferase